MNAIPHKHAEKIKQWADAPDWWDVYYRECATSDWAKVLTSPGWAPDYEYELRKSAKHPDNIKPKKRLIDWLDMPAGTMTNCGELRGFAMSTAYVSPDYSVVDQIAPSKLRLKEQTEFTYWPGGECPVPEGVRTEVIYRDGVKKRAYLSDVPHLWKHERQDSDIIAYRITGLADGFTDNPEEAV
jgi:hypothetical protein